MIKALKQGLISFGLIGVCIGVFGVRGEVSAQSSHLFRTYKHEVPPKLSETQEAVSEGKKVFEKRCWYCHGIEGKGDGPAAKTMFPKP
ncbi:MAG: c-type cytochrome, partial [Planctomycetes bacterium]|nr:c-type cytochrome [Planctomycetota bacterium]